MGYLVPDREGCKHKWQKRDKDDSFQKMGKYEVKRVKEVCIKCGEERIRHVKRRYK